MNKKLALAELKRISPDKFKSIKKIPLTVILEDIRSLNNIGSVFRTADAFIVENIILTGFTACPPHREIQKTALGATETVNWEYKKTTKEAIIELKKKGYKIAAIEQVTNSVHLNDFNISRNQPLAIVLGNEVKGVAQETINNCDFCIEVPQFGTRHSLNISVCSGIIIWELFNKYHK